MKSRLQRWGNKRAIIACAEPLYEWVRQGHKATRLLCIRNLYLPLKPLPSEEQATVPELVEKCHTLVVEFLLDFARGKVLPGELNKKEQVITKRQKPYSEAAGKDTDTFKNVSPSWFAITLACLYPFLADDKSAWPQRLKNDIAYPCTSLWPLKVVRRYTHFINTVFEKYTLVFSNYERLGGKYYNNPNDAEEETNTSVLDDSSDCDDVF